MSFVQSSFRPNSAWSDPYLSEETFSVPTTTSAAVEDLSPTATSFQHEDLPRDHGYSYSTTPRYIAPYENYIQQASFPDYQVDGSYTTTGSYSNSVSARGRSASDGSTAFTDHNSAPDDPTPNYLINGAGTQHVAAHGSQSLDLDREGSEANDPDTPVTLVEEIDTTEMIPAEEHDAELPPNPRREKLPCLHDDCRDAHGLPGRFFSRKADVTRHHKSRHDVTYFDCPRKNCSRKGDQGFTRRDHLIEHLRGFHMEPIAKKQTGRHKGRNASRQPSTDSQSLDPSHSISSSQDIRDMPRVIMLPSRGAKRTYDTFKEEVDSQGQFGLEDDALPDDYELTPRSERPRRVRQRNHSRDQLEEQQGPHPAFWNQESEQLNHHAQSNQMVISQRPGYATHQGMPFYSSSALPRTYQVSQFSPPQFAPPPRSGFQLGRMRQ